MSIFSAGGQSEPCSLWVLVLLVVLIVAAVVGLVVLAFYVYTGSHAATYAAIEAGGKTLASCRALVVQ